MTAFSCSADSCAVLCVLLIFKEMSAELRDLYFLSAKEVEAPGNKSALIVFVPFRQHKKFQRLQARLIRELEKKFP